MSAAETLIQSRYGLSATGTESIKIFIEDNGAGGTAAYVQASYDGDGKAINGTMELHVDSADFTPGYDTATNASGGTSPYHAD